MRGKVAKETAEMLLEIGAITLRPDKPFRFTSGIFSPIYIDNRIILSYPRVREKIIHFYIKVIKERIGLENIDLLSGTALSAIPYAAFISQKLNLPMVYVRETRKGHGKMNQIEGVIKRGQKVLIIEDHISTGGSLVGNVRAIRDAGGRVNYGVSITTYLMRSAKRNFEEAKIRVFSLTNFNQIIEVGIKKGYMKEKDKDLVFKWAENSQNWGKKLGLA